jgi:predicted DNA-binding protein
VDARQDEAGPAGLAGPATAIDGVTGNQFDRSRSGVAKFNRILAERLGVPVMGPADPALGRTSCPLLSIKFGELSEAEAESLGGLLAARDADAPFRVFMHDLSGSPLERDLLGRAQLVYTGNAEVTEGVRTLNSRVETLWSPATILDSRPLEPVAITVFSFGMAHKMRTDMFERLHRLLDATGRTYAVYVSNANHESVRLEDAQLVYDEMNALFPGTLYFLGNLSDVAVSNYIRNSTFFAAFFPRGARANNSTVVAAMEHGAVAITNLDEYSPSYLRHMETVIDIGRATELPSDPLVVNRLRVGAMEAAQGLSWGRFAERFLGR